MPTYDYRCNACGHEFELFQSMKDKPKRTCPSCRKAGLERLIGLGAGVIFKGSGFYETDYRSDSYKKGAEAEKKSSSPQASPCACGNKTAGECASGAAKKAVKSQGGEKKPATP